MKVQHDRAHEQRLSSCSDCQVLVSHVSLLRRYFLGPGQRKFTVEPMRAEETSRWPSTCSAVNTHT